MNTLQLTALYFFLPLFVVFLTACGGNKEVNNNKVNIKTLKIPTEIPFSAGRKLNASAISDPENKMATTKDEIISMVSSAREGDRIAIANGTYDIGELTLKTSNVQLFAKNMGKVIFNGHSKLTLSANNIVLEGIVFKEGDLDIGFAAQAILIKGNNIHISQCKFLRWGLHTYETTPLSNKGWTIIIEVDQYANKTEISDSLFTDLYGISILKSQAFIPNFSGGKGLWVHHNDWKDNPFRLGLGSGGEALHAGAAYSIAQGIPGEGNYDDDLGAIFEYNHIVRHFAEFEIVSLKSRGNVIRYNIVEDSQFAGFVIRMGNENLIYGNWMTGVTRSAVRISGERNIIAFNYFKSASSQHGIIELHSETNFNPIQDGLFDSYWAANQNRIHRNIIENAPYFLSILQTAPTDSSLPGFEVPPDYPLVSSPRDGIYSQNIILDNEGKFINISGANQSNFLSENTLKDNSVFSKHQSEWITTKALSFDPLSPLQITPNWNIFEAHDQLPPPDWWNKIDFN